MNRNIEFLPIAILGDGAGALDARTFGHVSTDVISIPKYRSKYFETCPSVWANAYAFSKLIKRDGDSNAEAMNAMSEWLSLFALHYLGIAHAEEHPRQTIVTDFDRDFWPAISGTYPEAAALDSLIVLMVDRTVIAGHYPDVVFFPARGREGWAEHPRLAAWVDGGVLSWERVSALLARARVVRDFAIHLRSIAASCLHGAFRSILLAFCDQQFPDSGIGANLVSLDVNPAKWRVASGGGGAGTENYLEHYPLKQGNGKGTTYYLLTGIDGSRAPWINEPLGAHLPAPADFRRSGEHRISVQFAGETHTIQLGEDDRVLLLSELLLESAPYWTRFPKNAADFAAKVRSFHRIEPSGAPGIFAGTQDEAAVVCLAPLTERFVREFPSALTEEGAISAAYDRAADRIRWTVTILSRSIVLETTAVFCKQLAESSVALWPSKSSPDWRMYAAKGTGFKQSYGRWYLVDECGFAAARTIDIENDEYVTVLCNPSRPCQPRALLLRDANDGERGLLVLAPMSRANVNQDRRPSLAMDFGTSNTCLATRTGDAEPATLTFEHAPSMIWGKQAPGETPGFVPFKWGGRRGYYPSILLSLIQAGQLPGNPAQLEPERLFTVDIPSLHDQLDAIFLRGHLASTWAVHTNLKWQRDPNAPWRSYFLALSLLYAHAELFMREGAIPSSYTFTFPLAFDGSKRKAFHEENRALLAQVRKFCFGENAGTFQYVDAVDESRAIAKSARATSAAGVIEIFIDVGGGTADIAVRHRDEFLVLDSVRLAGRAFFRFTERNLRHQLLASDETLQQLVRFNLETLADRGLERLNEMNLDLGTAYCVSMNGLDEVTFKKREGAILDEANAPRSYQRYRSQLFFRHLLTYGLLQACAAAADHKVSFAGGGLNIVCSGNAWGLLVFAHLHRSRAEIQAEAEHILESIKDELLPICTQDEAAILNGAKVFSVNLMNERDLRDAKTSVAIGALKAGVPADGWKDGASTAPYIGLTLQNVIVNGSNLGELRWCSRWKKRDFAGRANADDINEFVFDATPAGVPLAPVLTLFSKLGNSGNRKADQLPADKWGQVNGAIRDAFVSRRDLERSPINVFVADVLYPEDDEPVILDELARLNRSYGA